MNMGSRIVVHRTEAEEIKRIGGWVLIFGRRKVGKTYLIKNFLDYDTYASIRVDRSVRIEEGGEERSVNNLEEFSRIVRRGLKDGGTVVIDEFQRLPEKILEDLAAVHPEGRLILSGSSMRVVTKLIGKGSSFLGILYPYHLSQIKARDILRSLFKVLPPERAVELAPFLRDPWTIPLLNESVDFMGNLVRITPYAVPALVGEIFTEEEREMTRTYQAIISLMGSGYTRAEEIASILYTRGIVKTPASSSVLPYMKNLRDMGILRETKVYGKKKYVYRIDSEVVNFYYYLNSRYDLSRDVSFEEVKPTVDKLKSMAVERFIADLFAEIHNARVEELKKRDGEIDILLTRRNKPILVGEVKWRELRAKDVRKFVERVWDFSCDKVIFTRKSKGRVEDVRVLTPEDLVEMV
ncbi:MAG: AAA family ATPase [Thermoplasmata archaeon]|nr:AAA family ATPase [Thermoplasmata archaeon]